MTYDDHLLHNDSDSASWRGGDRLQFGINDFLRRNPQQTATDVFAFDSLIQNPVRRFNNQNLLTRGDDIFVLDHELAFSFLFDILGPDSPRRLDRQRYLSDHVFYRKLKSKTIDFDRFAALLSALPQSAPQSALVDILAAVPPELNNESLVRIEQHLRTVSAHAAEFAVEVQRRLA